MVSIHETTWHPLVIFAGTSTQKESRGYRPGNFLGRSKGELDIAGEPLLTRALQNYAQAEVEGSRIGEIHLLGQKENLEHLIPDMLRKQVILQHTVTTLGEKIAGLKQFGEQRVYIATADIIPSQEDLAAVLSFSNAHRDASFLAPVIAGDDLLSLHFRRDRKHKMYPLRNASGTNDSCAFSHLYAIRPSHARLDTVGKFTDACFSDRERGLRSTQIFSAARQLFPEMWKAVPKLVYCILGVRAGLDAHGEYQRSIVPIPDYAAMENLFAHAFYRNAAIKRPVVAALLHAPTLAMDIDDQHDLDIVRELYASKNSALNRIKRG